MGRPDDSGGAPFVAVTDYDRRVLRGLQMAREAGARRYIWVEGEQIMISIARPEGRVVTVCTPDGVAVNLSPDADEALIPGE